jgi:hypothetical protein
VLERGGATTVTAGTSDSSTGVRAGDIFGFVERGLEVSDNDAGTVEEVGSDVESVEVDKVAASLR